MIAKVFSKILWKTVLSFAEVNNVIIYMFLEKNFHYRFKNSTHILKNNMNSIVY